MTARLEVHDPRTLRPLMEALARVLAELPKAPQAKANVRITYNDSGDLASVVVELVDD
ncbi:hypothetical protein ACUTAF_19570 [Pseudomonas sp. SP16.1]|uniref:hypothetical protein n=1 Tax=Pseudomonas sp. SP16.1 TaxID=3458854 RepID=UPI004045303F